MSNKFLNLFTYESFGSSKSNVFFKDCIMLHDFDDIPKGTKLGAISMNIEIFGFDESDDLVHDCAEPLTLQMFKEKQQ